MKSLRFAMVLILLLLTAVAGGMAPLEAIGSCAAPANEIEAENCKQGNPASEWDIAGAGDSSIQGFATDISVNRGDTVRFKIQTDASSYRLDIYRIGYYGGSGARKVATVLPSAVLPQNQPACLTDVATKLTDCGNWAESASWPVPADAVSGVYIAKLVRTDTGGASHVIFVVRDDSSGSDLLFKTSDTTWQAYNSYGLGYIEYPDYGYPSQKAKKASYNRPFVTRTPNNGLGAYNWFFQSEYPMIRWLEANGYNVSYFTSVDADRRGAAITGHKALLSVGHDEYWSGQMHANVEAARDAGVHLAFFSGNSIYRKIRWENSIDGSGTPYRTMVCYNESNAPTPIDPADPPIWTGTWRNPTFSPPADGGRPENALIGTLFTVSTGPNELGIPLEVPQAHGLLRFWRNTAVSSLPSGQTATLGDRVVGYEFDEDIDNGHRPAGLMQLSSTTTPVSAKLLGENINIAADVYLPGTATHVSTLYRAPSRSLVFSAGTVQWSWGLDGQHDNGPSVADQSMRQATVNLFADMGIQPATLQPGLVAASASTDSVLPSSSITSPAPGSSVTAGSMLTITGTAADTGGVVGAVEVSTDNGTTWHPATGRENWSFNWVPAVMGSVTIRSRAVDDSGNLEIPSPGVNITVAAPPVTTIWPGTVPGLVDGGPDIPVELGVKFRSDVNGYITGIRFYKASANTGTHVGNLWTAGGTRLATATFTNESASGWQQVSFATPVAITANTVYVASYHVNNGHYSADVNYFTGKGMDSPPLHALASGVSGANGVYAYGTTSAFPTQSWNNANYWVDVVFSATPPTPVTLTSITVSPAGQTIATGATLQYAATGRYSDGSSQNLTSQVTWSSLNPGVATLSSIGLATGISAGSNTISATLGGVTGGTTLSVQVVPLAITTTSLPGGTLNLAYSTTLGANGGTLPYIWSIVSGSLPPGLTLNSVTGVISGTPSASGTFSFTLRVSDAGNPQQTVTKALSIVISAQSSFNIWPPSTIPGLIDGGPDSPVELGVKFRSDVNGYITGIRFYKASANTGTHVGNLWTAGGTRLATATFINESASGWQQVSFVNPVAITANTVYVASYHVNSGHYSADVNYFTGKGMDSLPLHALASGVSGANGVYAYGATSVFPTQSWNNTNYWVDVVLSATPPATLSSLAVTPASQTLATGTTQQYVATGTYSDGSTQNVTAQAAWASSNTGVATITSAGLATAINAGSSSITATLGGISGSTSLSVVAPLTISNQSLPAGTLNVPYSVTLLASNGISPYTWTVSGGTLPVGLSLADDSGTIIGTPTAVGSFSFTVRATDSGTPPQTATRIFSISIAAPPPVLSSVTVTPGNQTFFTGTVQQFSATGTYSDGSTQDLSSQATWSSSDTGVATIGNGGLVTAMGPGSVVISATLGSVTGSANLTVQVAPLSVTTSSLLGGTLNAPYAATLAGGGGTPPYTWSVSGGTLPTGLSLDSGTGGIAGTATAAGIFGFTVQITDSGNPARTATKALSITVAAQDKPILIVSSASNPFSRYYTEILRTEGFNAFVESDISTVSSTVLASFDVVILGEISLTSSQVAMLSDWVSAGGNLIAMRPDKKLAGLLGLTDKASTLSNAYLLVDTSGGPGFGIVNQTIQFHGTADRYTLNGASRLATLYSDAGTSTSDPAVTWRSVGTNGGEAAAFTYDLARSIVYTRQGNPAWAGQERDGASPIRSDDLFFGPAAFDPQPDWVDLNKVAIPQADEQQRLLANLIIRMNLDKKPLPRFWYLPRNLPAAIVMSGDDHGNNGTAGRFDAFISLSPPGCSVENWECIRGSSYIYPDTPLSVAQALAYNTAGFEIGAHISSNCQNWTPSSLDAFFTYDLDTWRAKYSSLPTPGTSRMHCIAWSDYTTMATVELNHGIRFDTNYYYWPAPWVADRPGMFTGSGMPMRFADAAGNMIDVYQAATQMTDESGQSYPFTVDTLLDRAMGPEGYYGVFTANMHTDVAELPESDAIVHSALARGIPVVSARQMLEWLDGRNASNFSAMAWNGSTLAISISAGQGANGLVAMAPVPEGQTVSGISKDGNPVSFTLAVIKGIQYARFSATSGTYLVNYVKDIIPPAISQVSPAGGLSDVGTGTKVSAVFTEGVSPATVNGMTFVLRDSGNNSVSATVVYDGGSRTATLTPTTPLVYSMTYTATIRGGTNGVKDISGNPLATDFTWSFTTVAQPTGPFSLWSGTTVPGLIDAGPDSPVELGVKFRSDVNGSITGIRFYKASTNTGTHVGNLWTSTGTLLATATFANETASGWQQVNFATPVAITANTVYVASYHTNTGHYSDDVNYFAGKGAANPPLHALADGAAGFNGVFAYGSTSRFPTEGWKSSNYWVDVVFQY